MRVEACFVLLTSLFLAATAERTCPEKCTCDTRSVRCLHQHLEEIPKVPNDAHTLDVRFNNIHDIIPGSFNNHHHLRSILMNDNQLTELRNGAFQGLRALVFLYLYRNKIRTIDNEVFAGLEHLEQLYLHANEIHVISPTTFSNLPNLERLYLHNNLIENIPKGSFHNLPKLLKLRLDSNAIVCDCSIMWMIQMMEEHNEMSVAATCYGPPLVTGTPLVAMRREDFKCSRPEIMTPPTDAIVDFGDDALFTCTVNGEPHPEIVWLHDSNEISLDSQRYEVMSNGSLMVHRVDENDVGVFECMAKNPMGEARSKPAKMVVHNKVYEDDLVFIKSPLDRAVKIDEPFVHFNCMATGKPRPHISWWFNKERIVINERIFIKSNGTLVIRDVLDTDAGTYMCIAKNIKGIITASAELTVITAPAFILLPVDKSVSEGERVEFHCKARGFPTPVISWFHNTLQLPESETVTFSDNNEILTISEASLDNDGLYHCRAENTEGFIEITSVLRVNRYKIIKPHITVKPQDTEAFKETTIQLSCELESEPPAFIEWRKDGTRIGSQPRAAITLIGNLIINNITLTDTGSYECSVFNEHGSDKASAYLTVKDRILPTDEYVNIALVEATRDIDQAISRTIEGIFNNQKNNTDIHALFKISRYPSAPARELARASEIYERALNKVKSFVTAGLKATSTAPFNYNNFLSPKHLQLIAVLSGCTAHREQKDCSDMCYHGKYRSVDGSCNNFDHPTWGSSLSSFRRILLPIYENGFSEPIGWNKDFKYNGVSLPGARLISTNIIASNNISEDVTVTHMAMQWGQWLDHDLDHALPSVSSETWDGVDCKKTCAYASPCFPIDVPAGDHRVTNRRCIDFIRTSSVCGSGETSVLFGTLQAREQINQLTSFIDASQVYGFQKDIAQDLRDLNNDNGLLRVGAKYSGKKPLLPTFGLNGMDCRRNLNESTRSCFVAGDIRANEQIGLAVMHTIFMREHNRIASELRSLNPIWSGDKIYEEARKVVGAEIQFITYEHWLPIILGSKGFKELKEYKGYNNNLNPSVSNVFATAALRFGHSMINPVLHRYDENFETIPQGHLLLRNAFFSPWRLVDEGGVDPLIRGMFITPAKLKTPSQNLNTELTERLFESAHAVALDLAAINIQRGRDHAIPFYTKWREFCNMSEVNSFDDLAGEISDKNVRDKLEKLYKTPFNIDVWVGGILEDQVEGGKVGPLFKCLLIEQFQRLRDGDRFWYENPSMFKPDQINQIKQTSLARIMCDNGDNIDTIGENIFLLPEVQDGLMSCEDIPGIDFRYWADCETCGEESDTRAKREIRQDSLLEKYFGREDDRFKNMENIQQNYEIELEQLKNRFKILEEKCNK